MKAAKPKRPAKSATTSYARHLRRPGPDRDKGRDMNKPTADERLTMLENHLSESLAGFHRALRSSNKPTQRIDDMPNMSYCRFRNTRADLKDCHNALSDIGDVEKELSAAEFDAFKRLVKLCSDIANEYEDYLEVRP